MDTKLTVGLSAKKMLQIERKKKNNFRCLCTNDNDVLNAYVEELQKVICTLMSITHSVYMDNYFSVEFQASVRKYGKLEENIIELFPMIDKLDNIIEDIKELVLNNYNYGKE